MTSVFQRGKSRKPIRQGTKILQKETEVTEKAADGAVDAAEILQNLRDQLTPACVLHIGQLRTSGIEFVLV